MVSASVQANGHASLLALDRLRAIRAREDASPRIRDYSTPLIDASCRAAMVEWCTSVVDAFDFRRETVGIAFGIVDRYLSAGKGRAAEALGCRTTYQLATIGCFYTAAKVFEPVQLGIGTLVRLCRGFYDRDDILAMERDVLRSLDWRVCASAVTPMEYVRQFLEAVPEVLRTGVADDVRERAAGYMDCATGDLYFATCRTSTVGAACLKGALNDADIISSSEKEALMRRLNDMLDFDLESLEARDVERRLLTKLKRSEPKARPRASSPQTSVISKHRGTSSPVSVTERI